MNHGGEYQARVRRRRREYEDRGASTKSLRRPFSVTADVPYTDVDVHCAAHYPEKAPMREAAGDDGAHHPSQYAPRGDSARPIRGSGVSGEACIRLDRTLWVSSWTLTIWRLRAGDREHAAMQPTLDGLQIGAHMVDNASARQRIVPGVSGEENADDERGSACWSLRADGCSGIRAGKR